MTNEKEPLANPEPDLPQTPESESHHDDAGPPRGTRLMAIVRWVLVALMAVAAVLSVAYSFGLVSGSSASAATTEYYCPMHPQVVQDHPGECPICSMTLVPREESGKKSSPKIEEKAESHEGHRHIPADAFYCPMHPIETGPDASARCPICKMKLEPRPGAKPSTAPPAAAPSKAAPAPAPATPEATAAQLPQSVPGLVPLDLGPDRVQLIGVRTARATRHPLVPELRTVGFVAGDEARVARVHTRFSGWIERLAVATTGQKVRRGQLLAGIYNVELLPAQQEFLAAQRWDAAAKGGASGPASSGLEPLEQDSRTRLELLGMSRSEIDRVARTGKPTRIVGVSSPIAGFVTRKNAVKGAYVQPGTELFEIADLSRVWVLADVYEYEIARVSVGQVARIGIGAYPGSSFKGKVGFIYPTLDSDTRTLRVRLELDNKDYKLHPGMYGDVVIELGQAEGVVIPSEGLIDTGELQYVFVTKEGGRFEPRRVRPGVRSGDKVQILEGLSEGDTVVTTANFLIDSESRLQAAIQGATP